jgi:hypothetical protein
LFLFYDKRFIRALKKIIDRLKLFIHDPHHDLKSDRRGNMENAVATNEPRKPVIGFCDCCERERELRQVFSRSCGETWACWECLGDEPEEEEEERS